MVSAKTEVPQAELNETVGPDMEYVNRLLADEIADAADAEHAAKSTCKDAADWLDEPDEPDEPMVRELIERGEMVAIVGQSKAGKSFIALQLAVCVAMGLPFLGRETTRCRVYIANLEVSRKQYKKRLRKICAALAITSDKLRGWLFVDNMKGETATWQWCREEAHRHDCGLVLIDPFYQIFHGDENDVNAINDAVDEMKKFQKAGLTTVIVYHSPKGFSGDRQLIDMISGSSILARFPETIIGLLNHAGQTDCRVVKCVLRNYSPPDDQTIQFDNGVYELADDIAPVVETARTRAKGISRIQDDKIPVVIRSVLEETGMQEGKGDFVRNVQDKCAGMWGANMRPGEKKVVGVIQKMIDNHELCELDRAHKQGGAKCICLPEQMEMFTNPQVVDGTGVGK